MTRELTKREDDVAWRVCQQLRHHPFSGNSNITSPACPTCRADIARLVDAPPLPDVREKDWMAEAMRLCELLHPVVRLKPCDGCKREALAQQQGGSNG